MQKYETFSDLTAEINSKRNLMIQTGMTKGLNHFETLQHSAELDKLIYTYQLLVLDKPPCN
ncbi:aspartyl-phosphate phosphatase Spo0E family protein [Bacillus sp. B190/17]|uniref:Aspartyl-phosphate phosphatase Spo0E family protein n=1 Tax=Bacillus lumedeiriae TaxID=3058829 RepID=A0ABW8I605_9BACI